MTKPNPANTALSISDGDLVSALAQIGAEIDHQPLRSSAFARIMRETFHGSDAGGAWDWANFNLNTSRIRRMFRRPVGISPSL